MQQLTMVIGVTYNLPVASNFKINFKKYIFQNTDFLTNLNVIIKEFISCNKYNNWYMLNKNT